MYIYRERARGFMRLFAGVKFLYIYTKREIESGFIRLVPGGEVYIYIYSVRERERK